MAPLELDSYFIEDRSMDFLFERYSDDEETEIEEIKKYYFAVEGENTELNYLKAFENLRKELNVKVNIKLLPFKKTGADRTKSSVKNLYELALPEKEKLIENGEFLEDDKFVLIFDVDQHKNNDEKKSEYLKLISEYRKDFILCVTSPCFEFWLMLHQSNIVDKIKCQSIEIFENRRVSNKHRFTSNLFTRLYGSDPKKEKTNFEKLILSEDQEWSIKNAIEQEREFEQDIVLLVDGVGSNIGEVFEEMIENN